jgi:hypothetical protein
VVGVRCAPDTWQQVLLEIILVRFYEHKQHTVVHAATPIASGAHNFACCVLVATLGPDGTRHSSSGHFSFPTTHNFPKRYVKYYSSKFEKV